MFVAKTNVAIAALCVFCWGFTVALQCSADTEGVRARLYWTNAEIPEDRLLAPNQSPNVDGKLSNFEVTGEEDWFTTAGQSYTNHYVLVLEAVLHIEEELECEFRLLSEARATLEIDGDEIAVIPGEDAEEEEDEESPEEAEAVEVELTAQTHRIKLTQYVNQEQGAIRLEWRTDEDEPFRPLPAKLLSTENFYFRPTNSTAKRLEQDADRPGKFQKVAGVYPGVDLLTIRPEGVDVPVGGLDVLPDGRLVVATFDARKLRAPRPQEAPDGELWLYTNIETNDPKQIRRERIAERLFEPCGVCVVGNAIFVSQRDEVTRFDYLPSPERWQPTTVATGWESNDFHALSFGLIHQRATGAHPGYLYMARGTGLGLKRNPPNHGSVWRINLAKPPGDNVEPITGGHRTPNGIGFGPDQEIFVTDNQGEFTPVNELNHIVPGRFYGFRQQTTAGGEASPFQDQPVTEAAVLMPQDEIANSPSEPLLIPHGWPYAGQMLVGDVKYGGINRVFLEKINDRWQGAVFRFTQGLEGGVNRLAFGRVASGNDSSLFVGGIGGDHSSTWNWVHPNGDKTYQGLQRLRPNGKNVFDLDRIEAIQRGFRVHFTKPVPRAWLKDTSNYRLTHWHYEATPNYGGPKRNIKELEVAQASPAENLRAVELTVAGRESGHVVHFVIDPPRVNGQHLWSAEAWYTLWEVPGSGE